MPAPCLLAFLTISRIDQAVLPIQVRPLLFLRCTHFMIFPLSSIWFGSSSDDQVARRVDRYEDSKRNRMAAGLYLDSDFRCLEGTLLIVSGHGKYLRTQTWSSAHLELPLELVQRLNEVDQSESPDLLELASVRSELAALQGQVVNQLKEQAGKYVDRILAISVRDPGIWLEDFDGQKIYYSLCDANRLAEITGLNVIDSFPARDLESGGNAEFLESLPLWLMLADRNQKAASHSRIVASLGAQCRLCFLPGSDGLDAELPLIQALEIQGNELFQGLAGLSNEGDSRGQRQRQSEVAAMSGRQLDELIKQWHRCVEHQDDSLETLLQVAEPYCASQEIPDLLRSSIVFVAQRILSWMEKLPCELPVDRVMISGDNGFAPLMVNELTRQLADQQEIEVTVTGDQGELQAIISAVMGFLTIDQMPASLPWITGCSTPQVLGQLTAGRPTSWRSLLIEMADYRPPVMKLKDAI